MGRKSPWSPDLFAAIVAAPDDDAPRLVYADWLTERGDPRGELIILQCRLAGGDTDDALFDRESTLLAKHQRRWLGEAGLKTGTLRRGFVEIATLGSKAFLKARDQLEATSVLRDLTLVLVPSSDVGAIKNARVLQRLERLCFQSSPQFQFTSQDASTLARSANLASLRHLVLTRHPIANAGVCALAEALPRLRHLEIEDCGVTSLNGFAPGPELEAIDLSHNAIFESDVRLLCKVAPSLVELRLWRTELSPAAQGHLSDSLPKLRRLTLARSGVTASGIASLGALPLVELSLLGNTIDMRGMTALLEASFIDMLEALELSHTGIGNAGLTALAKAAPPRLSNLRVKEVGEADAGIIALADSRLAGQLESLALSDNRFGVKAAMALANAEWPKLKSLELYGTLLFPAEVRRALRERFGDRLSWSQS
jgi:uncharacterized protein (TIGR02996 family)